MNVLCFYELHLCTGKKRGPRGSPDVRLTVIEKANEQIKKIKQLIEDWFPHLKGKWKYISMLYCNSEIEMAEELRNCQHCMEYIAQGPTELLQKIKSLDERMSFISNGTFTVNDYRQKLCRFFLTAFVIRDHP